MPIWEMDILRWVYHLRISISQMGIPPTCTLEKVQHIYCSPICTDCSWRGIVTTMLNSLDWPTLESHHAYSNLVMFYKIINSHIEVPSLSLSPIYTSTRGHSQHFRPPYARLYTYLFSFLSSLNYGIIFQKKFISNWFSRISILYVL